MTIQGRRLTEEILYVCAYNDLGPSGKLGKVPVAVFLCTMNQVRQGSFWRSMGRRYCISECKSRTIPLHMCSQPSWRGPSSECGEGKSIWTCFSPRSSTVGTQWKRVSHTKLGAHRKIKLTVATKMWALPDRNQTASFCWHYHIQEWNPNVL